MEDLAGLTGLLDGRYSILSRIAVGGSSVVYLALQRNVNRRVAIKILRHEACEDDQERERYLREASLIASLRHPNIVTVHDVGVTDSGSPYIVMEYVPGQSLRQRIRSYRLDVHHAVSIFEQIGAALSDAHQNGIIHRDVKPANVFVEEAGNGELRVKLGDFGVAKQPGSEHTEPGSMLGTPTYMAPELFRGHPASVQTDLYGFGVLMYQVLAGRPPFLGEGTPLAIATQHVNEPVPLFSHLMPDHDIPMEMERTIRRCLEKNPANRYSSVSSMLADLVVARTQTPSTFNFTGGVPVSKKSALVTLGMLIVAAVGGASVLGVLAAVVVLTLTGELDGTLSEPTSVAVTVAPTMRVAPQSVDEMLQEAAPGAIGTLTVSDTPPPARVEPTPAPVVVPRIPAGVADANDVPRELPPATGVPEEPQPEPLGEPSWTSETVEGSATDPSPPAATFNPLVAKALPRHYAVSDAERLHLALRAVEAHLVMAGADEARVRGSTVAFERELLRTAIPSVPLDIYPRPMFDLLLGEVQRGATPDDMSQALVNAQLNGALRKSARGSR